MGLLVCWNRTKPAPRPCCISVTLRPSMRSCLSLRSLPVNMRWWCWHRCFVHTQNTGRWEWLHLNAHGNMPGNSVPADEIPAYILLFPNLTYIHWRFKSSPVNAIFCQALAGSPLRPQRLAQLDKEQEEQLKPPFSATTEIREVRHAQKDDGGLFPTTPGFIIFLWLVTGGDATSERGGLHLHSQTHDCWRSDPGHCRHHTHLSSDRWPANQGVPQWLVLSAWGEAGSPIAPEQCFKLLN